MQIKTLEETLDLVLLDRRERPPKLTDIGEMILNEAQIMLAAETRIQAVAKSKTHVSGTLFLGVIPTASVGMLPEALKALKNEYPRLGIQVESGLSGDLIQRLRQGSLDAAIVTEPDISDSTLDYHLLLDEPLVLIDARQNTEPFHIDMLNKRPFIRFNRRAGVGQSIDRLTGLLGYQIETAMELDSIEAITRMVSEGLGIAIVPRSSIHTYHQRRLKLLPIDHPKARRRVILLSAKDSEKQAFITLLLTALQR